MNLLLILSLLAGPLLATGYEPTPRELAESLETVARHWEAGPRLDLEQAHRCLDAASRAGYAARSSDRSIPLYWRAHGMPAYPGYINLNGPIGGVGGVIVLSRGQAFFHQRAADDNACVVFVLPGVTAEPSCPTMVGGRLFQNLATIPRLQGLSHQEVRPQPLEPGNADLQAVVNAEVVSQFRTLSGLLRSNELLGRFPHVRTAASNAVAACLPAGS